MIKEQNVKLVKLDERGYQKVLQLLPKEPDFDEATGFMVTGRVIAHLDKPVYDYLGFETHSRSLGNVLEEDMTYTFDSWKKACGLEGGVRTHYEAAYIDALCELVYQTDEQKYKSAFIRSIAVDSDYCKFGEVPGCRQDSEKEMQRPVKAVSVILHGSLYEKVFGE